MCRRFSWSSRSPIHHEHLMSRQSSSVANGITELRLFLRETPRRRLVEDSRGAAMNLRRRWRLRPPRVCISLCRSGTTVRTATGDAWVERRRRVYALLEAADPALGRAVRWCESALGMFRSDGDMREARLLLRAALAAGVHYPTVYRAWTAMEADHAGDAAAARALFEEWRARRDGGGELTTQEDDVGGFWCRYIAFELDHGGAARARAVAELAVAACPRDPAVHARYAKAELRLGRADRARAVLARALDCLDDDDREWLVDEVKRYSNFMRRRRRFRRLCGLVPRFFRGGWWWSRLRGSYERLDGAT